MAHEGQILGTAGTPGTRGRRFFTFYKTDVFPRSLQDLRRTAYKMTKYVYF